MGFKVDLDRDWKVIEAKLPPTWRALATAHGILTDYRPDLGAKLADPGVLLRLILHYVTVGPSLRATTAQAAAIGLVSLSAAALQKWMAKAGDWLAAVLADALATATTFAAARWAGYDVRAVDASSVQRPGATGTTARVHVALRLADLRPVAVLVTGVEVGETLRHFAMAAGQLWLADRGYCNANGIAHAVAAGADVLIRFAFGPLPLFTRAGAALDVRARCATLGRPGRIKTWSAFVHPSAGRRIAVRVVAVRLPAPQIAKAAARLVREHGRTHVTAAMRDAAQYVVLVTTVPQARLRGAQLVTLYRLRWQVELDFKRDKSIAGLDQLPNFTPATIRTWLCAKMLAIDLARRLAEPAGEPFPPWVVGAYALRPAGFLEA